MMAALVLVVLGILSLIALPVVLVLGALFIAVKVVLALVLFPFRLAGWIVGGTIGAAALLVTGIFAAVLFGGLAILVLGAVMIPLVPVLLLAGIVYLLYRLLVPARTAAV